MSLASQRGKDAEMAAYMKKHPGRYPSSVDRPHRGEGAGIRDLAHKMGKVSGRDNTTFERGLLGGVLAAKLGYSAAGLPDGLI